MAESDGDGRMPQATKCRSVYQRGVPMPPKRITGS
jgi:hypothetical protein